MDDCEGFGGPPSVPTFTHKGWMLFCPVKLGNIDNRDGGMLVAARWAILEPLLDAAQAVQGLVIGLCSLFDAEYEPQFYFKITGELRS